MGDFCGGWLGFRGFYVVVLVGYVVVEWIYVADRIGYVVVRISYVVGDWFYVVDRNGYVVIGGFCGG